MRVMQLTGTILSSAGILLLLALGFAGFDTSIWPMDVWGFNR